MSNRLLNEMYGLLGEAPKTPKAPKKLKGKALEKEISRLYKIHGDRVEVNMFDLSKIWAAAEQGYETGGLDGMEQDIKSAIAQYRKN